MTKYVICVIGLSLVAVIGVAIYGSRSSKSSPTTVGDMKTTEAIYQLDRTSVDFGNITVNDVKSANFSYKNTGSDPIELTHFQTSCDCTSAIVKIGKSTSPEIGMAGMMSSAATNWQSDLAPGEVATITVTYNPTKMPVYGAVERTTKFMANSKDVTLTVKANVQ